MLLGLLGCGASPNNRALSLTILWASVVWLVDISGAPCDAKLRLGRGPRVRVSPAACRGLLSRQAWPASEGLPHARSGAFPRPILSLTVMKTHPGAGNL